MLHSSINVNLFVSKVVGDGMPFPPFNTAVGLNDLSVNVQWLFTQLYSPLSYDSVCVR